MSNPRSVIVAGSFMALLAVAIGAFGAHGLRASLDSYSLDVYHTGVQYHMMHALGLLLIGSLMQHRDERRLRLAALLMFIGIVLFSGSLYALAVTGAKWLGAVTPFGGVCFLLAWLSLCLAYLFPRAE